MIKTVSTHTTSIEAHIVRCRLEHEGIPAFIAFEHHIWAMWSYSLALGGVRVQVPESYLEPARNVVNQIYIGSYEAELNTTELAPSLQSCPKCGSEKIQATHWSSKIALIALFILLIPLPFTQHGKNCKSCSYKWIAHEERGYSLYFIFVIMILITILLCLLYELWFYLCKLHCENPYSLFLYSI